MKAEELLNMLERAVKILEEDNKKKQEEFEKWKKDHEISLRDYDNLIL